MRYKTITELPGSVKSTLPADAQQVYLKAYNDAWDKFQSDLKDRGQPERQEAAQKVAQAAAQEYLAPHK